ncbi:MAG: hypothetical protein D8M57_10440 [Candidatus Scalindua sp. AMX11]|nr:MAG: hypothetical protein DWQ00_01575 [Candidatus Scalindua sp.]TDE65007.1 MAG: hypothetical protein D8M57_10440 [Candidatus Scalindua sp. AMX11]
MKPRSRPLIYIIFFVIMIFSSHSICFATEHQTHSFDFRKTTWGMTKKEVKASELNGLQSVRNIDANYTSILADEVIIYVQKVAEMDVQTSYFFLNNSLVGSEYSFRKEYETKEAYVEAYDKLRGILARKYGPPISENKTWRDERFEKLPEFPSDPGNLSYESVWETDKSEIYLSLKSLFDTRYQASRDMKQMIRILYTSKAPEYLDDF